MNFYDALVAQAKPVAVEPSDTSYFSAPSAGLDPRLFRSGKLSPVVRANVLRILFDNIKPHYYNPEAWAHVWLAGSAVSYQWSSARKPADLDCLVGVDYVKFRQANPSMKAYSDKEIASSLNADFRKYIHPLTANYLDAFELTFYVNVQSDIKKIKPYAAYSVTNDDWTVQPEIRTAPINKNWERKVEQDKGLANEILSRYSSALTAIGSATTDAARRNAEAALKLAVEQGSALFEEIHHGRTYAFSESGQGYTDIHNYRWQSGKSTGVVQALKKLKDIQSEGKKAFEKETYGMVLPDANTLIRRALSTKR